MKSARWSAVAIFAVVLALIVGVALAVQRGLAANPWTGLAAMAFALVAATIAFGLIYGPKAFIDCLDAVSRFHAAIRKSKAAMPDDAASVAADHASTPAY